jgi:hypothetical protein
MHRTYLLTLLLSLIMLSGCITIHEKYKFNKNGSGTMEYIIDMSELFSMMQSLSEESPTDDIQVDQSFLEAAETLKSVKGISKILLTGNNKEYLFAIKFDFANIDALNEAMGHILQQESKKIKYVTVSGKKITRHSIISEEFSHDKLMGEEEEGIDQEMMKGIFEQMKYKVTMSFHRSVKSVNTKTEYQTRDKTVSFETDFARLIDDKKSLETNIILK